MVLFSMRGRRTSLPLSCTRPEKRQPYDDRVKGAQRKWELQQIHETAKKHGIRKPARRRGLPNYYKKVVGLPAAREFLCAGMDMRLPWDTSHLHWAIAQREHVAVATLLDTERIDINEVVDGNTALMMAVRAGDGYLIEVRVFLKVASSNTCTSDVY